LSGINIATGSTSFPVQGKSCSTTLGANSSCTISVAFAPQSAGALTSTLTVTDSVSTDLATSSLSGTGDDYQLVIPSSQPTEVSVVQGGTATFNAQVVPDNIFGQNGEKVSFVCPTNMPTGTTCSFNPATLTVTPGTAASFQVSFVTTNSQGTNGVIQSPL